MSFKSYFSPSCETRELHADPDLRTRYYRNNFTQVVEALKVLAEKYHLQIRDINEVHKEVNLIGDGFDCIVTVAQVTPIEAGIDLKINVFGSLGFGRPKKKAILFYKELKTILKFKGVSLHP